MALNQTLAVLHDVIEPDATRDSIIAAAAFALGNEGEREKVFEKDGYLWVGRIGLDFDDNDELQGVVRSWNPRQAPISTRRGVGAAADGAEAAPAVEDFDVGNGDGAAPS